MRVDGTLYFTLRDHLGSATVMTDANGVTVGMQKHYPFGATRLSMGDMLTDRLFTGQREMAGLGLYACKARAYDPQLRRFIAPDTIIPDAVNPRGWNRYLYVNNNPANFNDPTGHFGNFNDERSDYWNRRNEDRVPALEGQWAREKAAGARLPCERKSGMPLLMGYVRLHSRL